MKLCVVITSSKKVDLLYGITMILKAQTEQFFFFLPNDCLIQILC